MSSLSHSGLTICDFLACRTNWSRNWAASGKPFLCMVISKTHTYLKTLSLSLEMRTCSQCTAWSLWSCLAEHAIPPYVPWYTFFIPRFDFLPFLEPHLSCRSLGLSPDNTSQFSFWKSKKLSSIEPALKMVAWWINSSIFFFHTQIMWHKWLTVKQELNVSINIKWLFTGKMRTTRTLQN